MTPAGEDYTYWGILGIMLILSFGLALTIPVKADRATLAHGGCDSSTGAPAPPNDTSPTQP